MLYKQLAHYLHHFLALFMTIPKTSQQANLSWHAMDCQTWVGLPLTGRPWKACFDWQSLVGVPLTGRRWFRQTLLCMPSSSRLSLVCQWLADLGWCAMQLTGRPWLACHWLADLCWHAMHGQTLAVSPMIGIAWLVCYFLAELGWSAIDWQSLVAMPYSARLCLTSSLNSICNHSHYSKQ